MGVRRRSERIATGRVRDPVADDAVTRHIDSFNARGTARRLVPGGAWLLLDNGKPVGEERFEVARSASLATWRSVARRERPIPHEERVTATLAADGAWRALAFETLVDARRATSWEGRPGPTGAWRLHLSERGEERREEVTLGEASWVHASPLFTGLVLARLRLSPGEKRDVDAVALSGMTYARAKSSWSVARLDDTHLDVAGARRKASRYRLRAGPRPLDVWLDDEGVVLRHEGLAELAERH